MNREQALAEGAGVLEADLLAPGDELMRRFRSGLRRELAAQLAAGYPVYSGGIGQEAGMLIVHLPDGRLCEYRVREDGTHEIVRELPR
jgi:hypothetical protein